MGTWVIVVLAVVGIAALYVAADRARTLAVYRIGPGARGRLHLVRGRLPAEVTGEIEDVVKRARLASGTIIVRKEDGAVMVRTRGISDENAVQQLRNAVGRFPKARLRS
jgi:hypothetical protein